MQLCWTSQSSWPYLVVQIEAAMLFGLPSPESQAARRSVRRGASKVAAAIRAGCTLRCGQPCEAIAVCQGVPLAWPRNVNGTDRGLSR